MGSSHSLGEDASGGGGRYCEAIIILVKCSNLRGEFIYEISVKKSGSKALCFRRRIIVETIKVSTYGLGYIANEIAMTSGKIW
jgi:hypothetical protein